jgi:hypothetical protein
MEHLHPAKLLQPLEVPTIVWADITMDFIERFPHINGKLVVLTICLELFHDIAPPARVKM